jgi:hypothetical protein
MSRAKSLVLRFWNDQTGFVLTAELVLISTILVLGLIVGLTSVQSAVVGELSDVGAAIGSLNQSYSFNGFASRKAFPSRDCGTKAFTAGSAFHDMRDECDAELSGQSLVCGSIDPQPEASNPSLKHKDRDKDDDDHKRSDKDDDDDDDDRKRSNKNDKEDSDD